MNSDPIALSLAEAAAAAFSRRDFAHAAEHAQKLLMRAPNDTRAHLVLGLLALEQKNVQAAQGHLERVKAEPPSALAALIAFGDGLQRLGDIDGARNAFSRAAERGSLDAWRHLVVLERRARNWLACMAACQQVLAASPNDAGAHAALALSFEHRHDLVGAKHHAHQALGADPANAVAREALGRVLLREGDFAGVEAALAPLAQSQQASNQNRGVAWGLIGDARDQNGDAPGAFEAFTAANQCVLADHDAFLEAAHLFYHPSKVEEMIGRARRSKVSTWRWPPKAAPDPSFLVGFPRSGTTLLDQILASHAGIVCLEERNYFSEALAGVLTSPDKIDAFDELSPLEIQSVRGAYWLAVHREIGATGDKLVVDKMPLNIVVLPMIKRIFPDAKIIFAVRDPRDVVLSCYQQRFAMNEAMAQLLQLDTAAAYYDVVMRLMQVCRETLALELHQVRYEDVVADLETAARGLAAFLGLAYDPNMLDYRATALRRDIDTPSNRQVIQPLYTRSIGRWRRYAEQLAPALPMLAPWAQRFGYEPA